METNIEGSHYGTGEGSSFNEVSTYGSDKGSIVDNVDGATRRWRIYRWSLVPMKQALQMVLLQIIV